MGLFEKLGRKVGEFTHEAKQAANDEAGFVCANCENRFYTERPCPECGSEDVRELERPDDGEESGADDAGDGRDDETTSDEAASEGDETASDADAPTEPDGATGGRDDGAGDE